MKTSVALLIFSVFYLTVIEAQSQDADVPTGCQFLVLRELEAKLRDTQKELENLRREVRGNQVAFGASTGLDGNFGPFNTDITLPFKNCFVNTGSFNPTTGTFTAPVKGIYYFSFSATNHSTKAMGLQLMKNGQVKATVYNHPAGARFETAANGMTLELDVGDQVYMRLMANTWITDSYNHHDTFTGHLLFPL